MNAQRKAFVIAYLKYFNATKAAVEAGYSAKTAYSAGPRLLGIVEVKAAIADGLAALQVSQAEALTILADQARGDLADFLDITPTGWSIKLTTTLEDGTVVKRPNTRIIKKIRQKVTTILGRGPGSDDREIIDTEIELHDPQNALDKILRVHGAYRDNLNLVSSELVLDDDIMKQIHKAWDDNAKANP